MSAPLDIIGIVGPLLARTPEWVRQDLASKEPLVRERAEETLAMMIEAALRGDNAGQDAIATSQDQAA
jgi:hypothetical protein